MSMRVFGLLAISLMTGQTPGPARVVLTVDKPVFLLGENVLVHYCLEPASSQPISISVGADSRGASRSTRFKVVAVDDQGVPAPDPDPRGFHEGGFSSSPTIRQGEQWCQSLPLMRFARIDRPGTYRIRVTHDLGWPQGEAPEGEISLRLTMPTAAEAELVVAPGHPDFTTLRYAIYLEPLRARAQAGNTDAVAGLGSIPTPDSTRALISLLSHPNQSVARQAARWLAFRLPDPELSGALTARNPFFNDQASPRTYLIGESWRSIFAPDVRAAARTLLAAAEVQDVIQGAFFLEAVGTVDDARDLATALTTAIERTPSLPMEQGQYPRPRGAAAELMRAATMLVSRGHDAGASTPAAPGEFALWIAAFAQGARPEAWQAVLQRALAHDIPYVRELALDKMPDQVPDALVPMVRANLEAVDIDLKIAACRLADRARLRVLLPQVMTIAKEAKEFWLLNAATNALLHLTTRVEQLRVVATRLAEPDVAPKMLSTLTSVFDSTGSGGSEVKVAESSKILSERWLAFIDAHRDELETGQRLSLDRSDIPTDLVPDGWTLHRTGKPDWPPRK